MHPSRNMVARVILDAGIRSRGGLLRLHGRDDGEELVDVFQIGGPGLAPFLDLLDVERIDAPLDEANLARKLHDLDVLLLGQLHGWASGAGASSGMALGFGWISGGVSLSASSSSAAAHMAAIKKPNIADTGARSNSHNADIIAAPPFQDRIISSWPRPRGSAGRPS